MKRLTGTYRHEKAGSRVVRAASLLSFLIILYAFPAAAANLVDYLHVEANEGDSSGGHAAVRLGRYTFHFVHEEPGIVRLRRYDSEAFDYAYAKLGNRPIHQSRIAVADDTYRSLEDTFNRFLLLEDAQIEERDALLRDVHVIQALLAQAEGETEDAHLSLPAMGYFLPKVHPTAAGVQVPEGGATALAGLREKVAARYGADFLRMRLAALVKEVADSDPTPASSLPRELSLQSFPPPHISGATRFYEASYELAALSVLQGALPLRPGTIWEGRDDSDNLLALDERELETLARYAKRLEEDMVRVLSSRRPDRAYPLMVGMARLSAVRQSLATGRLVLLDFFPQEAATAAAEKEPTYLAELERELRQVFQRRRAEFFAAGGEGEARYTSLERAGNLLLEVQRARRDHTELRKPPVPSFPTRAGQFIPFVPTWMTRAALAQHLAAAREAERTYSALLKAQYSYDLLRRNCVTELFAVVNGSMAALCEKSHGGSCVDAQVREESSRRLGGYVDGTGGFVFIPFVSAEKVSSTYRISSRSATPSYRQEKLALMQEKEAPLKVFLRESNTITSTLYRPGPDDSFFLFFTDDAPVLRPLFGAFNLVAGVGETLYGVVTLPVQGTRHFLSGVKGVVFSVPELFFFSLRKGSMGYVERSPESPGTPATK
ncbi:hypothetical protein LPW11_01645 [Geomonas sp. RF6]|uniref:hypothetical protein n=1 Tax=Geomonas sp. RF6 TaxID=2897342 RepID=UPI001E4E6932|nr:hypothetical protein [Geomonas sp. RF6]UFS70899.1 hypothetical protein LPW11_01645 [Geomonas sp. RF6]